MQKSGGWRTLTKVIGVALQVIGFALMVMSLALLSPAALAAGIAVGLVGAWMM